jgi:pectate lyase
MRHSPRLRPLVSGVAVAVVAAGAPAFATGAAAVPVSAATPSGAPTGAADSGAWYESAYATWIGGDDDYRAYVRTDGAYDWRDGSAIEGWLTDWTEVDVELVREVDPARDTWRVDVPGLPRGTYDLQVRAADGTTVVGDVADLHTESFPRNGAAFVPSNQDVHGFPGSNDAAPEGVVGGYLPDGRVDPDADVVYLTPETMDAFPATVFSAGRGATPDARTPLVVRVLGTIGSFDTVATTKAAAGAHVPPGVNDSRMMVIGRGNGNVTVEGVGPDATLFGWGINGGGASNVEFRNLGFDQWYDDAIHLNGGGTGTRASNLWVHHNTFGYGQNKHLALGQDPDQAKGDGAVDVTEHARNYTVGYNHFAGSSKAMLIGGGVGSISAHYGTVDHNWFEGSEERTPRVRNGRVHVFNNLYQDIQGHPYHNQLLERHTGYGIGAGHNANVWAEGNLFDDVNFPFLRSRQGHARGSQPIDYVPGPGESTDANSGYNHFFGDAPGFIVSRESVTEGDFPTSVDGFRQGSDVMPGLTEEGLSDLRQAVLGLEPNVLDDASQENFDPTLDVGVVVAPGSTATNPTMNTAAAQLDWSFRPHREGVWPTGTPAQAAALRAEIETRSGAQPDLAPSSAPVAPTVTAVSINDEVRSAVSGFIPAPGKVVVVPGTFTVAWSDSDVLTSAYELQWDNGTGTWTTLTTTPASERPTSLVTQSMNQFATPETVQVLAGAADTAGQYLFRVRAVNDAGASRWSPTFVLGGELVDATPSARVTKQSGPTNELAVTVTETFSNGLAVPTTERFTIHNNAAGTYDVGSHQVHVATSGNTKVREIRIVG